MNELKRNLDVELMCLIDMVEGVGTELNDPSDFALGRNFGFVLLAAEAAGESSTLLGFGFGPGGLKDKKLALKALNNMREKLK